MHRRIGDIVGKEACSFTGCVKAKNGDIIMEKYKILERWAEYIGELYDDEERVEHHIQKNFDSPPLMKLEVQ